MSRQYLKVHFFVSGVKKVIGFWNKMTKSIKKTKKSFKTQINEIVLNHKKRIQAILDRIELRKLK